ncbi:MAG: iron ABC transporter permease [Thermomicrobiales bacterium]
MTAARLVRDRPPFWLLVPAIAIALMMLGPIVYLALRASEADRDIWALIWRERTARIAWNTLKLGIGVGVGSALIAVPLAWITTRTDIPWRRFWQTIGALPLVISSYAGALAIIGALGPRGLVRDLLAPFGVDQLPSIYGFHGALITLSLFTYPYVYFAVRGALIGLDPSLEEAARGLGYGAWRTFFSLTLPQLRPAIGAGALLAALYAVSDFSVVTLLRYDAFTRTIYTQYRAAFDRSFAAVLALMLIAFALLLVLAEARFRGRANYYRIGSGAARPASLVKLRGPWKWLAIGYCGLVAVLSLVIPISTLVWWMFRGTSTGAGLVDIPAVTANSLLLSALSAVAVALAATPVALLAVRYPGRLSSALERFTWLGYAMPGIAIALAFVFIGARYLTPLYQTLPLLVIAIAIRYLPQGVGTTRASLLQVSPRLEEAARSLGNAPFGAAMRVTVPLALPGILAGIGLVFLSVMRELPITLMLSPTGFHTLATEIWSYTGHGAFGRAATLAVVMIAVSSLPALALSLRAERAFGSVGQ